MPDSEPKIFIVSWDQFHRDCKTLAKKLIKEGKQWKGLIAVTRGGTFPAGALAREMEILVIETVGISSYDDQKQGELKVIKDFNHALVGDGEGWIVVDDLVDTGNTIKAIRNMLPKAYIATIYAKPAGEALVHKYASPISQDTWIYFPWDVDIQPIDPLIRKLQQGGAT